MQVRDYGEDGLAIYEDGTKETQEEHNRLLEEEAARQDKDGERGGRREKREGSHPSCNVVSPPGPSIVACGSRRARGHPTPC